MVKRDVGGGSAFVSHAFRPPVLAYLSQDLVGSLWGNLFGYVEADANVL